MLICVGEELFSDFHETTTTFLRQRIDISGLVGFGTNLEMEAGSYLDGLESD